MLAWFRKKRKLFAPAATAVFIGSLFSLYCPHCVAQMEQELKTTAVNGSNGDDHCAHLEAAEPEPDPAKQPCMGTCDCDNHAVLSGEHASLTVNAYPGSPGIKLPILAGVARLDLTTVVIPYTIGKPLKPDRACTSPLERTCVLLN